MAAMNVIGLPESSTFRDPNQIPLPNDPLVPTPSQEQSDEEDDEEGEESSSMVELAEQIDYHLVVIGVDNLVTNFDLEG